MKLEDFISFAKGRVFYCLLVLWIQSAIGSATTLTDLLSRATENCPLLVVTVTENCPVVLAKD